VNASTEPGRDSSIEAHSSQQIAVIPKAMIVDSTRSHYKQVLEAKRTSEMDKRIRMVNHMVTIPKFLLMTVCTGAAVSFLVLAPSAAQARDYPYCIKGEYYDSGVGDCSFDTYQQCLATASGRRAYCDVNPFYRFLEDDPAAYPDARRTYRR
jgi:hypothetical protein